MTDENRLIEPGSVTETPQPEITAPAERRGRGRPRKDSLPPPVSPADASSSEPTKPKARKAKATKFDSDSLGKLAKQIEGLHHLIALATGIPELQVQPNEAAMLGGAIANVCEEYDLSLSGKTGALLQLAAAAAMIYAPRFSLVTARIKENQRKGKVTAPLRVVDTGNHVSETPNA